jgi:hypothetical protein
VPSVFLAIAKYRVLHSCLSPRVREFTIPYEDDYARFTEVLQLSSTFLPKFEKAIQERSGATSITAHRWFESSSDRVLRDDRVAEPPRENVRVLGTMVISL